MKEAFDAQFGVIMHKLNEMNEELAGKTREILGHG